MKLLISPTNLEELNIVINSKADIIDIKNVKEGSLGAHPPFLIKSLKELIPKRREFSIAIGDVGDKPGSIGLSAFGAAYFEPNYIKVGLFEIKNYKEAMNVSESFVDSIKCCNNKKIKCVISGYADYRRFGGLPIKIIPRVSSKVGADIAMLDTAIKDGIGLFDVLRLSEIKKFVSEAKDAGLKVALAGSVEKNNLEQLYSIGTDIVGIRGSACLESNRNKKINKERINELCEYMSSFR